MTLITAERNRRPTRPAELGGSVPTATLEAIADRALWLAVRMIHEANAVRPSADALKVGGHQASSASMVSILTALYLRWLRPTDLVSVKPHASPAYHAIQYLLGGLDRTYLTTLRSFGGLQSYPSRTKDPDRVDFSTGSVGLGAVAPLYAALADVFLRNRSPAGEPWPDRRFVAVVGDAELDEGNVWETVIEDALRGVGNVTVIVDLNRQSLDRVVPGIKVRRLEAMFSSAGWQVLEAKYGRRLMGLFKRPGGTALRRRIDDMSNEEYQRLVRRSGSEVRARLVHGAAEPERDGMADLLRGVPDARLPEILSDLGGHDFDVLMDALDAADRNRSTPSIVFAYTIKGWRLPFAGDPLNHSASLSAEQLEALAASLGADPDDPWAPLAAGSAAGRACAARGRYLGLSTEPRERHSTLPVRSPAPLEVRIGERTSTQQAFGDALVALARDPEVGQRVVTAAPDVAVSTSLGGWINRVGVFAIDKEAVVEDGPRLLRWEPGPSGRHFELGISEMNLFMWLSQFGLTAELFGEPLIPIGTVYDPFICRGLDALIYALYVKSRFILAGTPSGVTLAPEGGAHQSTITSSIGIELPGLHAYEPAFAQEVVWLLEAAVQGVLDRVAGHSTYLRLSTRAVDQRLADRARAKLGADEWRRQSIAGGYRLIDATDHEALPPGSPTVNVVAMGSVVTEAAAAVDALLNEEVAASLIVVTSADRLAAETHDRRLAGVRDRRGGALGHLQALLPPGARHAPMVTVADGASHALSFMGGIYGAPVVPLGVDTFGQSGTIGDLYAFAGIDSDHIIDAALLAIELQGR